MPDFFVNKTDFERAVAERLAPLNQEIEALKNNRNQILAEKKALEGKTTGTTPEGVVRTPTHIHVPREIARDASRYQSFKALAQEEGLTLTILETPATRVDEKMPNTFNNDRIHYVSKAYIGSDGALYRKEKEFADSKGVQMQVVYTASELPNEAFLPQEKIIMLTQEYLFNSARPTPGEITSHDALIRDCLAGNERMKNNATQYVRKPDNMTTAQWQNYLRGAHFTGYAYATLLSWAGCANRKPHQIETDGMEVPFRLGYHDLDEQHLVQHAIYNVFANGRVAYYCDPGGAIVPYYPSNEVEIKCEAGKLTKAVFQEDENKRLDLAIIDGIAQYQWSDNEGVGDGYKALLINGKPIEYLPVIFINAADLAVDRSLSPLFEIASLSTKAWDLSLSQAHALWYCANPQPVVFGVSSEAEIPKAMGPSSVWTFSNPDASAELLTYQGDGIKDRAAEIARLEMQMSSMGAQVVLSKGNSAHTVSRTVELNSRASASDLVLILRNISDGLTILLRYLAEQKGKDLNKVFVHCNEDLLDAQMQADMVRALNEARRDGSLSFSTWIGILKAGELLPATLDADEEAERIKSDPTAVLGEDAESDMLDGGDGYPKGEGDAP